MWRVQYYLKPLQFSAVYVLPLWLAVSSNSYVQKYVLLFLKLFHYKFYSSDDNSAIKSKYKHSIHQCNLNVKLKKHFFGLVFMVRYIFGCNRFFSFEFFHCFLESSGILYYPT